MENDNIAETVGSEKQFSWTGEGAVGEFAADEEFLQRELEGSLECYCWGHC